MPHTTDSMTFEIFVGISFSSLLLFPGHGDIQKVSYTAQRQTNPSLKKISKTTVDVVVQRSVIFIFGCKSYFYCTNLTGMLPVLSAISKPVSRSKGHNS